MSIQELEEFLGSIQKKIVEQESMIGKNIQSIAPLLYEQERLIKQALSDAHSGECTEFVFDPKLQRDLLAGVYNKQAEPKSLAKVTLQDLLAD